MKTLVLASPDVSTTTIHTTTFLHNITSIIALTEHVNVIQWATEKGLPTKITEFVLPAAIEADKLIVITKKFDDDIQRAVKLFEKMKKPYRSIIV